MSGSLNHSTADIVRHLLVMLGAGTIPSAAGAWPIFQGKEPDQPDNCITVYDTDGTIEGRSMVDGESFEHPGIQVRVRATDERTGYVKANAIKVLLDEGIYRNTVPIDSSVYFVQCVTRKGSVLALGRMKTSSRELFTINAIVAVRQVS